MLDHADPLRADRGHVSDLRNLWSGVPGLGLALTLCRDQPMDGPLVGLAHITKRVPDEFVSRATLRPWPGRDVLVVKCQCGAWMIVPERLEPCDGGCNRFFFSDRRAVYAIRLPEQEA